ncbi:MAG: hypothetical protein ACE5J4_03145 [Candidatus Aenigmatarchaeota archaeon]
MRPYKGSIDFVLSNDIDLKISKIDSIMSARIEISSIRENEYSLLRVSGPTNLVPLKELEKYGKEFCKEKGLEYNKIIKQTSLY